MATYQVHSSDTAERERLKADILRKVADPFEPIDVVVTTYEMAKAPNMTALLAHRTYWRYIVLDEGHVIKNEASQISRALRGFNAEGTLLLTGTPLQNNLHELWALLNNLYPTVFPPATAAAFDGAFDLVNNKVRVCDCGGVVAEGVCVWGGVSTLRRFAPHLATRAPRRASSIRHVAPDA